MWRKFTERARRAVFLAQEEAAESGSNFVHSDHLLLGLLREDDCLACRLLDQIRLDRRKLCQEVKRRVTGGDARSSQDMQLTVHSKRVIDVAYDEARSLNNEYIGTEHLLLGLMREPEGPVAGLFARFGAGLDRVRQAVREAQGQQVAKTVDRPDALDDTLRGRDLVSIRDLSSDEIAKIFEVAAILKSQALERLEHPILSGKTLAMIFEKPSLRTRVTFEVGMTQLGGHAIYLQPSDIRLGERETVADAARNLERWVQGIMARTFAHQTVMDLAKHSRVPVINGLSDLEHPCQALTDFFTVYEKKGNLAEVNLAYIGDGASNTCHSLTLVASKVGAHMSVGCPEGHEPNTVVWTAARRDAKETGASITVANDPFEAAHGADVIYTDVWTSMGQEEEREARASILRPYQVNESLIKAAKDDVVLMHCLPAHRGEEITDGVMDGPHSVVFDQAENRLHVQKAILALVL